MEVITVDISWQDNYGASSEQVPGCVATHKTLEGVKEAFESALEFHLEGGDENPFPKGYGLTFRMDVHAMLNHYKGVVTFSALSEYAGVNEKQLGHYAQGYRKPRPRQRKKIVEGLNKIGKELAMVV